MKTTCVYVQLYMYIRMYHWFIMKRYDLHVYVFVKGPGLPGPETGYMKGNWNLKMTSLKL